MIYFPVNEIGAPKNMAIVEQCQAGKKASVPKLLKQIFSALKIYPSEKGSKQEISLKSGKSGKVEKQRDRGDRGDNNSDYSADPYSPLVHLGRCPVCRAVPATPSVTVPYQCEPSFRSSLTGGNVQRHYENFSTALPARVGSRQRFRGRWKPPEKRAEGGEEVRPQRKLPRQVFPSENALQGKARLLLRLLQDRTWLRKDEALEEKEQLTCRHVVCSTGLPGLSTLL